MMPRSRGGKQRGAEDLVELGVERLGARGDGIAVHGGEPIFLPFTVPGDRVRTRLGARRRGGREGRVVEWLDSGKGRATPPCPHFGRCGGCALQHLDLASYRAFKLGVLRTSLERVGIDPGLVQPLRAVPAVRRRAQLGLIRPQASHLPARVGFRERFRHELVDLRECPVLEPGLLSVAHELRLVAGDLVPPGGTAEVILTRTDSGVDLLLEAEERPGLGALEALAGFAESCDVARIVWRSFAEQILVVERRPVRIVLSGVAVPFPPGQLSSSECPSRGDPRRGGPWRRWPVSAGARFVRWARHLRFRAGRGWNSACGRGR